MITIRITQVPLRSLAQVKPEWMLPYQVALDAVAHQLAEDMHHQPSALPN